MVMTEGDGMLLLLVCGWCSKVRREGLDGLKGAKDSASEDEVRRTSKLVESLTVRKQQGTGTRLLGGGEGVSIEGTWC